MRVSSLIGLVLAISVGSALLTAVSHSLRAFAQKGRRFCRVVQWECREDIQQE